MNPGVKRHITEHEAQQQTPAWVKAAMRHKFGLNGLPHFDPKLEMTDEEYADAVRRTREHQPGLLEPQTPVPMPVSPPVQPSKPTPAKPREE